MLTTLPNDLLHLQPAVRYAFSHPELWMFDASSDGATDAAASAVADIEPGIFEVTTERFQNGTSFDFLIHRFMRT